MGPGVIILLRSPLDKEQIDDLGDWLRTNTTQPRGTQLQWEFMMDGFLFEFDQDHTTDGLHSFGLYDGELQMEESELEQVRSELGYTPLRELVLYAMAKSDLDHRILGHLALALAERYNAAIDFGGPITASQLEDGEPCSEADAGTVIEVKDSSQPGDGFYHVMDTTAMRAWLKDPHFHLVK